MRTNNFDKVPEIGRAPVVLYGMVRYTPWQLLRVSWPAARLTGKQLQQAPGFIATKSWMPKFCTVVTLTFWTDAESLQEFASRKGHRDIQAWAAKGNVKGAIFRVYDGQSHGYALGEWLAITAEQSWEHQQAA